MGGRANEGVPNYGIADDFPLLWKVAEQVDFAERLGGCTDPMMLEIDKALRELWVARECLAEIERIVEVPS